MKWYVLQVKSGEEVNVMNSLKQLQLNALVPRENRLIRSAGKWIQKEYLLFPSYVFVNTEFTASNYYQITSIPSIYKFLGNTKDPSYLTFIEAEWIHILAQDGNAIEPAEILINEDGSYQILNGVLGHFKSKIIDFNKRQKRVTCEITICNEIKKITLSVNVVNEKLKEEVSES